jgi:hypothetical protein
MGNIAYLELTNVKKPKLDKPGMLHWPVLPLYLKVKWLHYTYREVDTINIQELGTLWRKSGKTQYVRWGSEVGDYPWILH